MVVRALNGVGLVASRARSIKNGNEFDAYFPKPNNSNPILSYSAENEDTLERFIPQMAEQYKNDTERISVVLKQDTLEKTLKAVWHFVYNHIQYKLDEPHEEQIRRPARTWADRKSGVDCDCYSVFILSILKNLNIRSAVRMTAYNRNRGYQHVYIVVPKHSKADLSKRSDYFVLDCVMDAFDSEKPFIAKKDRLVTVQNPLNGFPIRSLTGTDFNSRSNLVYDDVYYSPSLGTWALKGIDGGYYLRGDQNLRYVEPINGLDGKILKKFVKVAKKVAKAAAPLAKMALKAGMNTMLPGSGAALTAISSLTKKMPKLNIKSIASGLNLKKAVNKVIPINSIKQNITSNVKALQASIPQALLAANPQSAAISMPNFAEQMNESNEGGEASALTPLNNFMPQIQPKFNTDELEKKIKATNNNTIQSLDTTKNALQKSLQANNKAVITSLDAVDKASKARLDDFANLVNQSLSKMDEKTATTEEITQTIQNIAEKTAALSAGTQAINREQSTIIKSEAQKSEQFRAQVQTYGKYALMGIALVIAWVIFSKNKQQTTI